jgi:bifunctional non-homologous end joining protein LigD
MPVATRRRSSSSAFAPMILRRVREPFDNPAWIYEPKIDGFRCVAFVDAGVCRLVSRNGHVFRSWPSLCTDVAKVVRAERAVLDGELVCLDDDGRPNFRALMFRRVEPILVAFDLQMLDGKDLRAEPLVARKMMLRRIVPRGTERLRSWITSSAAASTCSRPSANWTWRA